jgi:hypothetical protein
MKSNVAVVELVTGAGLFVIIVSGTVVSTMKLRSAGEGSVSDPQRARTSNVFIPFCTTGYA